MILVSSPVIQAANYRAVRRTPLARPYLVVLHTAENDLRPGGARAIQTWASSTAVGTNPDQVSAHFAVDNTEAIRGVDDTAVAFTQSAWNDLCLSIEHAGRARYTADEWAALGGYALADITSEILAAWCVTWTIPCRRVTVAQLVTLWRDWQAGRPLDGLGGITTHADITAASQIVGTAGNHSDPGAGFPIDLIIQTANQIIDGDTDMTLARIVRFKPFANCWLIFAGGPPVHLSPEMFDELVADGVRVSPPKPMHAQMLKGLLVQSGCSTADLVPMAP